MKQEVVINGRFLTQQLTGVQRVAYEFSIALDQLVEEGFINKDKFRFTLLVPQNTNHTLTLKNINIVQYGRLKGHLWEQIELPLYSRGRTLINLCGPAPIIKLKQIVTVHDAAVYANKDNYSLAFKLWYRLLLTVYKFMAISIITVSNFSKSELKKYVNYQEEKIKVCYLGVDHINRHKSDKQILEKYGLEPNFALAVSSKSPNKNFKSIIEAFKLLNTSNFQCVIVGGTNKKVFKSSEDVNDEAINNNVKYLGYITDEELKCLYEHAGCFVFPSFYEGFGLPPLEAMSCGCPVIVSQAASLPEVCGNNVLYCDPFSCEDISSKIKSLLESPTLKKELGFLGKEHSKKYKWRNFAVGIWDEISKIV